MARHAVYDSIMNALRRCTLQEPFSKEDFRRARGEIERAVARAIFGLDRAELEHPLDAFPTARDYGVKDLEEFRTRRLILEAYDGLASFCGMAPGRPVSESGRLCRGDGAHGRGARAAGGW